MSKARYTIFEPSNGNLNLNRNIIAYGLISIGFIIHFSPINVNETFRIFYILLTAIIFLYFLITSMFSYQPLNGKMQGELEFMSDIILIKENKFRVSELNDLYLHYEDYFGEQKFYIKGDLNQTLRQGVKNFIQFSDASSFQHKYYFRIDSQEDAEKLIPFISKYNN